MTDTVTTAPSASTPLREKKWVKPVAVGLGAFVLLSGTFVAGMKYEDHRIEQAIVDAFGDMGSDTGTSDTFDGTDSDVPAEPVEAVEGQSFTLTTSEGGTLEVTMTGSHYEDGTSGTYDDQPDFTRQMEVEFKVKNVGDVPVDFSGLQAHAESDSGEVYDFSGIFADNELPTGIIRPGKFVEGSALQAIPSGTGILVFNEDSEPFFVKFA